MSPTSRTVFEARRPRLILGACLLSLALSACGGGSSGGMGSGPPPSISLEVSPQSITLGQSATLTWSSGSGMSCTASGAWSGAEPASGSQVVTPETAGSLSYTLSCSGGAYGGSAQRTVTLTVDAPSAYSATLLVADTAGGGALANDASLVNPWGVAFGPTTFAWVANAGTGTSTLYDGNGKPQPAAAPLVVSFAASVTNGDFEPSGIVYNASTDFVITSGANSGPARFVFVGEGGMLAGWAPNVDATHAITTYTDPGGAVYKGLAIANNGSGNFLYATDFHNAKIDVFDATFTRQTPSPTSFAFTDPALPAGYAPFGIQALPTGAGGATQLYVSYAQQSPPDNVDEAAGAGLGLVDVFDTNGNLVSHLIPAGGKLNAPWGMALAPADFGTLSHDLLVGNFGDGTINAYDPASGAYVGTIAAADGTPFALPGLWGIAFGNDTNNQPHNTLFFAAGTNDEANGAFGRIDVGAAPPVLNAPPVVAVTAPSGSVSGTVTVTATAQSGIAVAKVELFAAGVSLGVVTSPPYAVQWDTTAVANGNVALTATATDVDGNVGTSPAVSVTVSNGAAAATLSQLQAAVFTPICSACHNGSNPPNGALPGSQNLTAGNSYAALVNVASQEQPALLRVKPGDPANSYLIQKLEGAATISGQRMPLGGPFPDQATIDQIKSWIAAGAPNN
jgi:uncharacterized protein (TIGR03118 family)